MFSSQFSYPLCWTLETPASNIGRWSFQRPTLYSWLNSILIADFVLAIAFRILLPPIHALTLMHAAGPLLPVLRLASPAFPWFSRLGLVSPFACHTLALRDFTQRFVLSPA